MNMAIAIRQSCSGITSPGESQITADASWWRTEIHWSRQELLQLCRHHVDQQSNQEALAVAAHGFAQRQRPVIKGPARKCTDHLVQHRRYPFDVLGRDVRRDFLQTSDERRGPPVLDRHLDRLGLKEAIGETNEFSIVARQRLDQRRGSGLGQERTARGRVAEIQRGQTIAAHAVDLADDIQSKTADGMVELPRTGQRRRRSRPRQASEDVAGDDLQDRDRRFRRQL